MLTYRPYLGFLLSTRKCRCPSQSDGQASIAQFSRTHAVFPLFDALSTYRISPFSFRPYTNVYGKHSLILDVLNLGKIYRTHPKSKITTCTCVWNILILIWEMGSYSTPYVTKSRSATWVLNVSKSRAPNNPWLRCCCSARLFVIIDHDACVKNIEITQSRRDQLVRLVKKSALLNDKRGHRFRFLVRYSTDRRKPGRVSPLLPLLLRRNLA